MQKNSAFIILGVLFGLNFLAWIAVWDLRPRGLEVTFFDVGQGDAALIETPQNHQILIDGGPTSIILEKLVKEMPFWDRSIDLVVLTHPERDHLAGLLEVLKRYKIQNILWTGIVRDTAEYTEWQKLIESEGANIHIARAGQRIEGGLVLINVLHPFEALGGKEVKDSNNTSIILRLVYSKNSFLFTGDSTEVVEKELTKKDVEINSDVLKVGHHGSKASSAEEFIKAVSPEIAVISVGKDNKYGHPHQETLDNLADAEVFRTDLASDIKIVSDGENYQIKKR